MNELPELPDAIAIRTRLVPDGPEITVGRGFSDEQMRSYALSAVQAERNRIEKSEVVQFLYGAGDLDGVGYSEVPPGKPRYWWRSILRAAIRSPAKE